MKQEVQERIKVLNASEISFESEWTLALYEQVEDIIEANGWKNAAEVLENLSPKIQTVYLLVGLKMTISNDGFFSVFYNESFSAIQRLRNALKVADLGSALTLFDETLQLVQSKFQWTNENENFIDHEKCTQPYEYFGDETTDRIETIEGQLEKILYADDFETKLEQYMKSKP